MPENKDERHERRKAESGLVRIHPWVPVEDREWFLELAANRCQEKRNKGDNQ